MTSGFSRGFAGNRMTLTASTFQPFWPASASEEKIFSPPSHKDPLVFCSRRRRFPFLWTNRISLVTTWFPFLSPKQGVAALNPMKGRKFAPDPPNSPFSLLGMQSEIRAVSRPSHELNNFSILFYFLKRMGGRKLDPVRGCIEFFPYFNCRHARPTPFTLSILRSSCR